MTSDSSISSEEPIEPYPYNYNPPSISSSRRSTPSSSVAPNWVASCRKLASERPPVQSVGVNGSGGFDSRQLPREPNGELNRSLSVIHDMTNKAPRKAAEKKHRGNAVLKSCALLVNRPQAAGGGSDARPAEEELGRERGGSDEIIVSPKDDPEELGPDLSDAVAGIFDDERGDRIDVADGEVDAGGTIGKVAISKKNRVSLATSDPKRRKSDDLKHGAREKKSIESKGGSMGVKRGVSFKDEVEDSDGAIVESGKKRSSSGSSKHPVDLTASTMAQSGDWDPAVEDEENSREDKAVEHPLRDTERLSLLRRQLSKNYDDTTEKYIELPASTHTLLHTEPILSIPFLFSIGVAILSATCLLLTLVNELSDGQNGNWLDCPTGVSAGVRGAQYCGIFVGLLMEEEIPQGLILLRSISRSSFHATYPGLSYNRFIFSCLLRLTMGYLFLMNLFVTIVQADDVITIFFDILALEFVQHLDDMAFELARKDILGRHLNLAASIQYKVLMREAYMQRVQKIDRLKSRIDEEKALKEQKSKEGEDTKETEEESDATEPQEEESRFYCFRRRRPKKKLHFGWILKAAYFINTFLLLAGTIIIGGLQSRQNYHCKSITVLFGDEVFENAYVTNITDSSQPSKTLTLVYSYFNGVYKITGRDNHGYPIYTEMNKISGKPYLERIGAEFVYCKNEGVWVFRHQAIYKLGISSDEEEECSQWLFRSPPTTAYDLVDVPHEDWSVWTGVVKPENQISIACNTCSSNSDCNYHGKCGEDGECLCDPEFFGLHCQFPAFCEELIDDMGEKYTVATYSNKTLLSYGRPIYQSRLFDLFAGAREEVVTQLQTEMNLGNKTASLVLVPEEVTSGNSTSNRSRILAAACYPGVRKIRIHSNTGTQIAMYEFEAYSSGVNVALLGTAVQSSNRNNGEILYASNAIDGNFTTFSHTNDRNAMFEVDLGDTYPIESVQIHNRYCGRVADPLGCLCRLTNATLTLIDKTDAVVDTKTLGDTCGELTVSESFTSNYDCLTDAPSGSPVTESPTKYPTSLPITPSPSSLPTDSPNAPKITLSLSSPPSTDPVATSTNNSPDIANETAKVNNSTTSSNGDDNAFAAFEDVLLSLEMWGSIVLVYSGSRWFGTIELSADNGFERLASMYDEEYHAFWDNLYKAKTFFISDPTSKATPVGVDFYDNVGSGITQWEDYGPFGLLTPIANTTGQGFFHCWGTNISAVKVASGTGSKYGG